MSRCCDAGEENIMLHYGDLHTADICEIEAKVCKDAEADELEGYTFTDFDADDMSCYMTYKNANGKTKTLSIDRTHDEDFDDTYPDFYNEKITYTVS